MPKELIELMDQGLMPDFRGPDIRAILLGREDVSQEEMEELNLMKKLHENLPPTFVWGSYEDTVIPATDYIELADHYYKMNIPCELHLFGHGPHGVSLCDTSVKNEEEIENLSMNHCCLLYTSQSALTTSHRRKLI